MRLESNRKRPRLAPVFFLAAVAGATWLIFTTPETNARQKSPARFESLGPVSEQRPNRHECSPVP